MAEDLFEFYRGDDYTLRVEITDELDSVVDITGWAFKASMKLSTEMEDDEAPVQVDVEPVSGPEAEAGVAYILLPYEQTKDLLPTRYFFDLQREINGRPGTVFSGKVLVKPDVTRRVG